jgi:pimeloyl-ACP methyl ester carboxylesterase
MFTRHPLPRNLNIPALVITGGQDPMFTAQMGGELAAQVGWAMPTLQKRGLPKKAIHTSHSLILD